MKKQKIISFSAAIYLLCLLTMTSCSAAEVPADDKDVTAEPLAAGTTQTASFSDVPAGAWYAEAVEYCRQRGIMNGVSDTAFAPEETLTRAMLVTICGGRRRNRW